MQRGFVHVFIPKLELHIVVAHLHAHDAQQRIQECQAIVNHLRPYLEKSEKVNSTKCCRVLLCSKLTQLNLCFLLARGPRRCW